MKIHHIGYLVDDIKIAAAEFAKLGFSPLENVMEDSTREVYIQFLDNGGYIIELIQPVSEKSPFYSLRKKYRNSPYHICYATGNLQRETENILNSGSGYILLQPPEPAPAIRGGPDVAFFMNENIGMIELVELMEEKQ